MSVDKMTAAYIACSQGSNLPELIDSTGEVLRAFGIEVPDEWLQHWFRVRPDQPLEHICCEAKR